MSLTDRYEKQTLANGYELVNGEIMHAENGDQFRIPPKVLKRHIGPGHFVELRIDSPRFSVHEDSAEICTCPSCHGSATKPILRHEQPATLFPLPEQEVPSRGWGEDFWVQVTERDGDALEARVDNPLVEARLHELRQDDVILFHEDHILAIHPLHRQELVSSMSVSEIKALAIWLGQQRDGQESAD